MKVITKDLGDVCFIEVMGLLDAEHSSPLKKVIQQAKQRQLKKFLLDLKGVSFIDSTGLGVLLSLMRYVQENEGKLKLANLQEEVHSIFEITRLTRVFEVYDSVEQAMASLH